MKTIKKYNLKIVILGLSIVFFLLGCYYFYTWGDYYSNKGIEIIKDQELIDIFGRSLRCFLISSFLYFVLTVIKRVEKEETYGIDINTQKELKKDIMSETKKITLNDSATENIDDEFQIKTNLCQLYFALEGVGVELRNENYKRFRKDVEKRIENEIKQFYSKDEKQRKFH